MKSIARMVLVCFLIVAVACAVSAAEKNHGSKAQFDRSANRGPSSTGTVVSISETSITIKEGDNQKTFAIGNKTRVMVRGEKGKLADVKAGDLVNVGYTTAADNTMTATRIVVPKPFFSGQVTSIQGNTIIIQGKDKIERKVVCSEKTKFASHGHKASITDIRTKYTVKATGTITDNTINADSVEYMPVLVKGNVTAVAGDTITVKTMRKGDITLKLSASTAITIKKEKEADKAGTIADIKAGETVSAGCQSVENGAVQVLWVDITAGM